MRTVVLNTRRLQNKQTAHGYLQRRLRLPGYYGHNLDALYDVLTSVGDKTRILILHPQKAEDHARRILDTILEAGEKNENLEVKSLG